MTAMEFTVPMEGKKPTPLVNGRIVKVDCPISKYLASKGDEDQPILSRSDLVQILECPSKWKKGPRGGDRRTWQTDFGSLVDCLLTQPAQLSDYFKLSPQTYVANKGKRNEEIKPWTWKSPTCRAWREEQEAAGFIVCGVEDLNEAKEAIGPLMQSQQIVRLLDYSEKQVFSMAEYEDEETGITVTVKTLTDLVPDASDFEFGKCLFDLKTARSAAPWPWTKAVFESDYHTQAAMNLDAYVAATGEDRCDFRHLIIENEPPYESAKRFLSSEFISLGRNKYLAGLKAYCQCVKSGIWPSYRDPYALLLPDGFEAVSPTDKMI